MDSEIFNILMENANKSLENNDVPVGAVVVKDGKVVARLPLPIAGLISDNDIEYVLQHCEDLNKAVKNLGCSLDDAFMTMGLLSLPVIPELKITDKGLFSTKKWDFVGINAE